MWFSVNLLFKSVHPDQPQHEFLWEERVFLVQAEDEDQARQEAERIGKAEEHEYLAATGDLVRWTFQQIESISALDSDTLENVTEVFSRFLSSAEVESLLTPFQDCS
jgi:hypothetical protein